MPNKSVLITIGILTIVAILLGFNYFYRPFAVAPVDLALEESPLPSPAAISLGSQLSAEEKVAQLLAMPLVITSGELNASDAASLQQLHPGFVTVFGSQISTTAAELAITTIKNTASLPNVPVGLIVDHEGGTAQRLNGTGFTRLPAWQSFCNQAASGSGELLTNSAQELNQVGINIVLAPVIDVATANPALGSRTCSSDPEVVAEKAGAFILAMNRADILPVLKHFPGIGQTTRDLHRNFDRVTVDLAEAGLYPRLLDQYPQVGVMVSHVGVENQYPDIPCSLSKDCVGELVANYPRTLIFSDALEMVSAGFDPGSDEFKPVTQRAAEAVISGNDILIFGPTITELEMGLLVTSLTQRYKTDEIFALAVDRSVERVLLWKKENL